MKTILSILAVAAVVAGTAYITIGTQQPAVDYIQRLHGEAARK